MRNLDLLDRIYAIVDAKAYLTPAATVDPKQRAAMETIGRAIQSGDDAESIRTMIREAHESGAIDRVKFRSAMHVLEASPAVADYAAAGRWAAEQEQAAWALGGATLEANLASVDRHRGVLAFLQQHHEVALDYFSRALERERTAENAGNVLASLISLGEHEDARAIFRQLRRALSEHERDALEARVFADPDLALLTQEVS